MTLRPVTAAVQTYQPTDSTSRFGSQVVCWTIISGLGFLGLPQNGISSHSSSFRDCRSPVPIHLFIDFDDESMMRRECESIHFTRKLCIFDKLVFVCTNTETEDKEVVCRSSEISHFFVKGIASVGNSNIYIYILCHHSRICWEREHQYLRTNQDQMKEGLSVTKMPTAS